MAQHPDASKQKRWLELIGRWQQSQFTIREFCERHHISEASFFSWRRVLRQRGLLDESAAPKAARTPPQSPAFVKLSAVEPEPPPQDPLAGDLFVFRSKRGDRLKLLYWDSDGLAIWYKKQVSDCTRFFPFTDSAELGNNLARRLIGTGGMDSSSSDSSSRR